MLAWYTHVQIQKVRCKPQGRASFESKSVANVWLNSRIYIKDLIIKEIKSINLIRFKENTTNYCVRNSSISVSSKESNLFHIQKPGFFISINRTLSYLLTMTKSSRHIGRSGSFKAQKGMTSCWECDGSEREHDRNVTYSAENLPNRPEACLHLIGEFPDTSRTTITCHLWRCESLFSFRGTQSSFRASTDGWMDDRKCNSLVKCWILSSDEHWEGWECGGEKEGNHQTMGEWYRVSLSLFFSSAGDYNCQLK